MIVTIRMNIKIEDTLENKTIYSFEFSDKLNELFSSFLWNECKPTGLQ